MKITRRRLLVATGLGVGAGAVGLGVLPPVPRTPAVPLKVLTEGEFGIVAAVADQVLPGPKTGWPAPAEVQVAEGVDALLAISPPATLAEVKQALRLFDNALVNGLFALSFTRFSAADAEDQAALLHDWQHSGLDLRRQVFTAVRKLCCGVYFAHPAVYAKVGYAGPPDFKVKEESL